jgi:hypothetical protein
MAKTATESQQKNHDLLRFQLTARLARIGVAQEDLADLSLAELLNTLFLLVGDGGSIGSSVPSLTAALKLVGTDLLWQEPDKIAVLPQRIQ